MITINNFTINNTETAINVSVTTDIGETISSALVWTDETFKDYSQAIDVSDLLSQTSNMESFSIPATTLGEVKLTGIYFIEFETTAEEDDSCAGCNNPVAIAASLNCYQDCLLNKVLKHNICDPCSCDNIECDIINTGMILDGLIRALQFGYYGEAIDLLASLKKLCNSCNDGCEECNSCTDCGDLPTPSFKTGLNYGTLNGTLVLI